MKVKGAKTVCVEGNAGEIILVSRGYIDHGNTREREAIPDKILIGCEDFDIRSDYWRDSTVLLDLLFVLLTENIANIVVTTLCVPELQIVNFV